MRRPNWTNEEIVILRENDQSFKDLLERLPNRTMQSIKNKRWRLGLKLDKNLRMKAGPKRNGTWFNCDICGNETYRYPSEYKNDGGIYCSRECYYNSKDRLITFKCDNCGNEKTQKPGVYKKNKRHFCSSECHYELAIGPLSSNWQGGKSFEPYNLDFNNGLKETIRQRDEYICQYPECGTHQDFLKRKLDIHHIDGNKKNNNPWNLISLCIHCHPTIENSKNTEYWKNHFYNITSSHSEPIENLITLWLER